MFLKYWERGYSVTPVVGKDAFLPGWSRGSTERQRESLIEEYERMYPLPQYGIGIVLGRISGICGLDIDSESKDIRAICPPSPVAKRGINGETRFFKWREGLENCSKFWRPNTQNIAGQKSVEGVEIFASGRQTVVPPSFHPTSKVPYFWLTPDTLENFDSRDLPDLLDTDIKKLQEFFSQYTVKRESSGGGVGELGRNNRLTTVSCAIICRNSWFTDDEIAQELLEIDSKEHSPPYFSDHKESYFKRGNTPYARALYFVREHRKRLVDKGEAFISKPIEINVSEIKRTPVDHPKFPEMGGMIGTFKDAILSISRSDQKDMALGAALSIAGTLSANRFHINGKPAYTTMYVLNIAGTSSGKGAAVDFIHDLFGPMSLGSTNGYQLLGLHNYSSDVAIIARLADQRTRLDVIDEFGQVFKGLSNKGDRKAAVGECLKILFSSRGSFAGHHTKTDGTVGACLTPSVSLFGAIQQETLLTNASPEVLFDGFMGRFMYFMENLDAQWLGNQLNGGINRDVLDMITKHCLEAYPVAPFVERDLLGNLIADQHMREYKRTELFVDQSVVNAMEEMDRTHYVATQKKKKDGNPIEAALLGRSIELTEKLSRIICISDGVRSITLDHLDLARKIVDTSTELSKSLLVQAGLSKEHRDAQKVIDAVRHSPDGICARREILKHYSRTFNARRLDEIIKDLMEQGVIELLKDKPSGGILLRYLR